MTVPKRKQDLTPVDPISEVVTAGRAARMTWHEIAWMLASAVRIPTVTMMAASTAGINARLFTTSEADFVLLWKAASSLVTQNGGSLPQDKSVAKELLALQCSAQIATDPNALYYTAQVQEKVLGTGGLLDEIYAMPVSIETEAKGFELLSRFLIERVLSDAARMAIAGLSQHDTMSNPMAVFEAMERKARDLVGLAVNPGKSIVAGGIDAYKPRGRVTKTTNRKFMDTLLGGGYARKEAYSVSGVTSGGKTAMMANLIVDACENETALAAENPTDPCFAGGHWYYFTYELNRDQLMDRMHAYGARIHLASLGQPLSTNEDPQTMKPYEFEPFVNSPGNPVMGEIQRLRAFRTRFMGIGDRLEIVDYSGEERGHGRGGTDEILRHLRREISKGRTISGFVVDYAGLVVNRYMAENRIDPKSEYQFLKNFGDQVRNQICVPLDCTGWVLHQLHGDAGKKASGVRQHHSANLGCHNFADNFDYGIQFGMYNGVTGLLSLSCSKHRSSARNEDGVVARFDGRFGAFLDPEVDYTIDPMTGQIVRRDYLDQMPVGPSTPQPTVRRTVDPRDGAS